MGPTEFFSFAFSPSNFVSIGLLFALMAMVAGVEAIVPLRTRGTSQHAMANLALTVLTLTTGLVLGGANLVALAWLQASGFGLMNAYDVALVWNMVGSVLALDFATYVCHVAMHKVPGWWRYHRVHHSDATVDVTTAFRQHPGETVIRYAFLAAVALALGVSPAAFAFYRLLSALTALPEHANVRVPAWVDDVLSLVVTWPTLHKVHHSRLAHETDTNYGNIFSIWDRLFFTFTPARRGREVAYGLDGFDDAREQSLGGLLAMPFRDAVRPT